MSFRDWTNTLNTQNFGSVTTQLCWVFGSLVFTVVAAHLFWAEKEGAEFLAGSLLAAWLGKSVSGVVDKELKRAKDVDYVEAKGKAAATANQGKVTVQNVEQVTVTEKPAEPESRPPEQPRA